MPILSSCNVDRCRTFLLPAIYVTCIHPSSWDYKAFFNMTNLMVWFILSFLIFFFAATGQVALVQSMGPGLYSSFTAIRIVGAVALSSLVLKESIRNRLEGIGLAVNVITITVYLIFLYKEESGVVTDGNSCDVVATELNSPDIEEKDSMKDSSPIKDNDRETDNSSPSRLEFQRLVKRK